MKVILCMTLFFSAISMHTFSSFEETVGSHLSNFFIEKKGDTFTVYFDLWIKNVKFNNEYYSFLFQVNGINSPPFRFYFRWKTKITYLRLNLLLRTINMQFAAILVTDQPLAEVMICTSVMTLIPINIHTATLATHTNLQQDTSATLHKPNPFLLEVITLHQPKLKCFFK